MSLFEQAATFLEAGGWQVERTAKGPASIVGVNDQFGGQYLTVWCPDPEDMKHLRQWEPTILKRLAQDKSSPGSSVLLLDSQAGLTPDFRHDVKECHVTLQVPIQFFDAKFCWDDNAPAARRAASAGNHLNEVGLDVARKRTPQPYRFGDYEGDDLLFELTKRFESNSEWERPIILVTAPAGFGKSWLFQSLFARAHQHFKDAKQRQDQARRPLPLLPDYVARASSNALPSLVEQFLIADVAGALQRPAFEWMLGHGYACWMLDGLDEVIATDPYFFEYIEELIYGADKKVTPRILICARDSLLSTSPGMRALVNDIESPVTHFTLLPWQRASIETFAIKRLDKQALRMTALLDQPAVLKLCGTPYYSDLVAERILDKTISLAPNQISESDLVGQALEAIVRRDYGKDLDAIKLPYAEVRYLIGEAAIWQLEETPRGLPTERLVEDVEILLESREEAEGKRAAAQILKLSVFGNGMERNRLRFAHDVIFEYLIGQRAIELYGASPDQLVSLLNHQEFGSDSISLRLLANSIDRRNATDALIDLFDKAQEHRRFTALRNLIRLVLSLRDAEQLLRKIPLENSDLSKLTFTGLTLSRVSMREANLESATFDRCDLSGLDLSEAVLFDTTFHRCKQTLRAASFGSLSGFVSVNVDGKKTIETPEGFSSYLQRTAKQAMVHVGPCPTAVQLRKTFYVFLHPDGKVRRTAVERSKILRAASGKNAAVVLDMTLRAGFLSRAPGREMIKSSTGTRLTTMASFASHLQVSPEIKTLLDHLCPIKGCVHIGHR